MPVERLSALDASFLAAESATAHMHVGWAAAFDPPADGARPSFEALREHVARRLPRSRRYRQRLASVPLGVHDPVWVDDPQSPPGWASLLARGVADRARGQREIDQLLLRASAERRPGTARGSRRPLAPAP